jgi:hypothetical protein
MSETPRLSEDPYRVDACSGSGVQAGVDLDDNTALEDLMAGGSGQGSTRAQ